MRNPFSRTVRERDGFPAFPGAFPLLGHLPMIYEGFGEMYPELRKLGPVVWLEAGFGVSLLLCSGVEALEILKNKAFTSTHLQEMAPLVAGQSVLAQDGGPAHRHMRGALNGPFLPRGLSASAMGRMSAGLLSELVAGWVERGRAKVLPEVQRTALEIIFRMLGAPVDDLEAWRRKYRDLLLANLGIRLRFPGSPAVRSEKAQVWIDAEFRKLVAEVRGARETDTLLGKLVHAKDEDGQPLTEPELLDNLRLLVLGGHETISSTMAWMALRLASHPSIWDELVAEASKGERVPETPEEARAFPYAEALFRETVRSHPAFGTITRKLVAPFELYGKPLPVGALVAVHLWGISHDESVFPEPFEFRPARWLGRSGPPSAIEMSQFGAGPHFCLGYHLAWLEGVQIAVALARAAGARGVRPRLRDPRAMRPIYLPTEHPSPGAMIHFEP